MTRQRILDAPTELNDEPLHKELYPVLREFTGLMAFGSLILFSQLYIIVTIVPL